MSAATAASRSVVSGEMGHRLGPERPIKPARVLRPEHDFNQDVTEPGVKTLPLPAVKHRRQFTITSTYISFGAKFVHRHSVSRRFVLPPEALLGKSNSARCHRGARSIVSYNSEG